MKNKYLIMGVIIILTILLIYFLLYPNTKLKNLEDEVNNIALPPNIEKIAIKSAIGDSGGNGDYSTLRVILVVKTELTIDELKQEFENINLKFPNHYKNNNNTPIFYITHCASSVFESSRDFTVTFNELTKIEDYSNYYFIEFVE
mgnify:CR=1 FL=1